MWPHYRRLVVKRLILYSISSEATPAGRGIGGPCYHAAEMRLPAPARPSLTPPAAGHLHTACRGEKSRVPNRPLTTKMRWGPQFLLRVFCLVGCHFLQLPARNQVFLGSFGPSPLVLLGCWLLQAQSERQKENPGNSALCHVSAPNIPSQSTLFSAPSSSLFVLYIMSSVSGCT